MKVKLRKKCDKLKVIKREMQKERKETKVIRNTKRENDIEGGSGKNMVRS